MDTLRKYLFLKRIYFRTTIEQIAYDYLLLLFGLFFGFTYALHTPGPWLVLSIIATPIIMYMLVRTVTRYILAGQAMSDQADLGDYYKIGTRINNSAMSYELDGSEHTKMLAGQDGTWEMYEVVFNIYKHTKNGDYLAKEAYYTVFEGVLTRPTPHLIFDGKRAKGRQFKKLYLQSQRLTLEGNFNQYFDVYSPEYYQIDTLSFITPDVMEALLALQDYDVELVDGRLLCAGPLLTIAEQRVLQQKSINLVEQLNYNLKTYRDDRLAGIVSKNAVTPFARTLLKNPVRYLPGVVISTILLGVLIYMYTRVPADKISFQIPLVVGGYFVAAIYRYFHILTTNRRQITDFKKSYQS